MTTTSTKTTKLTISIRTPERKPSMDLCKVLTNVDEDKIIQVPRVTKKDEDDISTVSYKGYFSICSDDSEKENIEKYKKVTKRKNCIHKRTGQTSRRRK